MARQKKRLALTDLPAPDPATVRKLLALLAPAAEAAHQETDTAQKPAA